MSQPNSGLNSSPSSEHPTKRKRGRPRKEKNLHQQGETSLTQKQSHASDNPPAASENLVGQVVSGVIEGTFDAGYFLNVKVNGTDNQLRGVVFSPGRVVPITQANDVAPHAKMYRREEVSLPRLNQQLLLHGCESKTNDGNKQLSKLPDEILVSELRPGMLVTDKSQSCPEKMPISDKHPNTVVGSVSELPSGISVPEQSDSESGKIVLPKNTENEKTVIVSGNHADVLIADKHRPVSHIIELPNSWLAKEKGDTLVEKIPLLGISLPGTESQSLSLMPQTEKNEAPEAAKEIQPTVTRFFDYLPESGAAKAGAQAEERETGSSSNPNLNFFAIENQESEYMQNNPPARTENFGMNLLTEKPVSPTEELPENLQLELGSKIVSVDNVSCSDRGSNANKTGANPRSSSMSGFLANLFEDDAAANEPENSVSQGGSPCSTDPQMNASAAAACNNNNEDLIPR